MEITLKRLSFVKVLLESVLIKVQLKLFNGKSFVRNKLSCSLLYSWTQSQKHKYVLSCGKQENLFFYLVQSKEV